jgi:hypothetical protein
VSKADFTVPNMTLLRASHASPTHTSVPHTASRACAAPLASLPPTAGAGSAHELASHSTAAPSHRPFRPATDAPSFLSPPGSTDGPPHVSTQPGVLAPHSVGLCGLGGEQDWQAEDLSKELEQLSQLCAHMKRHPHRGAGGEAPHLAKDECSHQAKGGHTRQTGWGAFESRISGRGVPESSNQLSDLTRDHSPDPRTQHRSTAASSQQPLTHGPQGIPASMPKRATATEAFVAGSPPPLPLSLANSSAYPTARAAAGSSSSDPTYTAGPHANPSTSHPTRTAIANVTATDAFTTTQTTKPTTAPPRATSCAHHSPPPPPPRAQSASTRLSSRGAASSSAPPLPVAPRSLSPALHEPTRYLLPSYVRQAQHYDHHALHYDLSALPCTSPPGACSPRCSSCSTRIGQNRIYVPFI